MIIVDPQLEKLMPELTQQEYDLLKSNILKDGCRHPIVLWNNIVIDGHNRLKICEELSIDYSTESIDFDSIDDVKEWIFDNQMGRRNLKPDHISWLRGRCYQKEKKAAHRPLSKLSNKGDQNDHLKTAEKIAEKHGVGTATIRRDAKFAEAVETVKKVDPEIESKIIKGTAPPKREIIKQAKKIEPRKEIKQRPITSTKSTFNATNDNIEWAKWTWNPVTGCLHECPYCYAKDISMRYYNHFKPCPTTVTDASGYYTFTSLPAGDYVVVVTPPADHALTGDPDSYSTPCTLDPVPTGCDSQSGVTLSGGQIDRSHDFGYQPPGVLGDYVWFDVDGDGVQDLEENGIAGVTVELRDGSCTPGEDCPTAVTDSDGYYSFGGLTDGTYTVVVDASTLPAGLAQTYDPDDTLDHQTTAVISGGSVSTMGGTSCSDCDYDADFGYQLDGDHSISGTVFYDGGGLTDGTDDVYGDTGDVAYSGITVYLWGDDGLIGTTATDANGFYSFADLPDGTYTVTVNVNSPGLVGMALTAAGIYEVENYHTVTISGASVSGVDWGFFREWDFGDLPSTYRVTLLADDGPYHITSTLRLGISISADDDGQEDGVAEGDDDDGVTRDMADFWLPEAQVNLIITTTGGTGRLAAWINWNGDTDISDPGEFVDLGNVVAGAGQVLTLTIPSSYAAGTDLYVRFRLFDPTALPGGSLDAADYLGSADNGEVEDYFWQFGPTAVGSHGLDVRLDQTWEVGAWLMPLALVLLMAAAALVARWRRTPDVPVRHHRR